MTSATLVEQLASFAADAMVRPIPDDVAASTRLRMLDTLGIALAASATGVADGLTELVLSTGGSSEAGIIGREGVVPAGQAAFVGGALGHSLDFDDTHLPSIVHPSSTIVPAVLATGEATSATGPSLIAAAAVGIELTVRLGLGGYLEDGRNVFFERGWHATSICGALGAAASAGCLLGLDATGIGNAMAIATSFGSGLLEANRSGGTVKRLHCGWAANAGIYAARLAARGYTGPSTALEGHFGFYRAHLGDTFNPAAIVDGLGDRWELPGIFFKPYPANHYTHAAIDATLGIRRNYDPDPRSITRIELGAARAALRTIGEPREEKVSPRSGYHAQFSGPFAIAAALLGTGEGLGIWFGDYTDDRARDPERLAIAAMVETFVDPECDSIFPRQFGSVVRMHTNDGRVLEERVMANRGGSLNPLSQTELLHKFRLAAGMALSQGQVDRLADAVLGLAQSGPGAAGAIVRLTAPNT
jgi:2-methylcitrate dehydratase PrpD